MWREILFCIVLAGLTCGVLVAIPEPMAKVAASILLQIILIFRANLILEIDTQYVR